MNSWKKTVVVFLVLLGLIAMFNSAMSAKPGTKTLAALAGPDVNVLIGQTTTVYGSGSGGTGPLNYSWTFNPPYSGACLFNGGAASDVYTQNVTVSCSVATTMTGTLIRQ